YLRLQDWQQLALLLPELKKYQVVKPEDLKPLERTTWLNLLEQAAAEARRKAQGDQVDVEFLNLIWDRLPRSMREDDMVIGAYAEHLARLGHEELAETVLRKVLRNHWSDLLVNIYGRVQGANVAEQLATAEGWLKDRSDNPALLLALGRLSLRNELWGKARDYFEASLKRKRTRETYAELCRLMAHLGHHQESTEYFIQGLLEDSGLPELPMPRCLSPPPRGGGAGGEGASSQNKYGPSALAGIILSWRTCSVLAGASTSTYSCAVNTSQYTSTTSAGHTQVLCRNPPCPPFTKGGMYLL